MLNIITSQTGGRLFDGKNLTAYSHFVGGVNATYHALQNYSPLVNGFGRLFMVRPPLVLLKMFGGDDANLYSKENQFIQFKHMLEYMNRSVTGIGELQMQTANTPIQGGFAGRQFTSPTVLQDTTQNFRVGLFEFVGCPVKTVVRDWLAAIGDPNSGLATYGGWISGGSDVNNYQYRLYQYSDGPGSTDQGYGIPFNEANHTCEFIYIMHDRSGAQVESAIMLADCYPTGIDQGSVLNMEAGANHDHVTYDLQFNCVPYSSPLINAIADDLLKRYRIVSNSLNFNPELGDAMYAHNDASKFNQGLGGIPMDSALGTDVGNFPVYKPFNAPKTVKTSYQDVDTAKLAGQPDHRNDHQYFPTDAFSTNGTDSAYGAFGTNNWGYERDDVNSSN